MDRKAVARGCGWVLLATTAWIVTGVVVFAFVAGDPLPGEPYSYDVPKRVLAGAWLFSPLIVSGVLFVRALRRRGGHRPLRSDRRRLRLAVALVAAVGLGTLVLLLPIHPAFRFALNALVLWAFHAVAFSARSQRPPTDSGDA